MLGTFTAESGLSVAFIGDAKDEGRDSASRIAALRNIDGIKTPVDVFFSGLWPQGIDRLSQEFKKIEHKAQGALASASKEIADLSALILPKYHIASAACYFEREPYSSSAKGVSCERITKFVSLADFHPSEKSVG